MHKLLYALVVLVSFVLFATSCNVTTSIHFNRNYSGSYVMEVDLSDLMSMAMMFDSSGASEEDMFAEVRAGMEEMELVKQLEEMDGIDNVVAEVADDGVVSWSFDFDDMDALNNPFQSINEMMMSGGVPGMDIGGDDIPSVDPSSLPSFTRNGKVITHRAEMGDLDGLGMGDLTGGDDEGALGMMTSMIDFTFDLTFDRKVKDVQVSGMDIIKQDAHLVRARVDLKAAMEAKYYELNVKLK